MCCCVITKYYPAFQKQSAHSISTPASPKQQLPCQQKDHALHILPRPPTPYMIGRRRNQSFGMWNSDSWHVSHTFFQHRFICGNSPVHSEVMRSVLYDRSMVTFFVSPAVNSEHSSVMPVSNTTITPRPYLSHNGYSLPYVMQLAVYDGYHHFLA